GNFTLESAHQKQINTLISGCAEFHPPYISRLSNIKKANQSDESYYGLLYNKSCYEIKSIKRNFPVYFRGFYTGWDNSSRCQNKRKPSITDNAKPDDVAKILQCQIENVIAA